jgi:hypothetical protein
MVLTGTIGCAVARVGPAASTPGQRAIRCKTLDPPNLVTRTSIEITRLPPWSFTDERGRIPSTAMMHSARETVHVLCVPRRRRRHGRARSAAVVPASVVALPAASDTFAGAGVIDVRRVLVRTFALALARGRFPPPADAALASTLPCGLVVVASALLAFTSTFKAGMACVCEETE